MRIITFELENEGERKFKNWSPPGEFYSYFKPEDPASCYFSKTLIFKSTSDA